MTVSPPKPRKTAIGRLIDVFLFMFVIGLALPPVLKLMEIYYPIDSTDIIALRRSIIGQESAGNYSAINPDSGALGYAQVMPENVPSWSYEALGYSLTPEQFLASPDLQLRVIDHKLEEYWQEALAASNGDETIAVRMVASRWYSGTAHLYDSTTPQYYNGSEYPSIADYTLSILNKYQEEKF
jgi:hypothetical protein